jgi:uncharacterized protein (DUF736 family)
MSNYDNTNTGALFKNTAKDGEKSPDYRGSINVDGVEHWLSAWIKKSKEGKTYMSLSIKPKEEAPKKAPAGDLRDMDDDVPF